MPPDATQIRRRGQRDPHPASACRQGAGQGQVDAHLTTNGFLEIDWPQTTYGQGGSGDRHLLADLEDRIEDSAEILGLDVKTRNSVTR